jgi:hypothetical protein
MARTSLASKVGAGIADLVREALEEAITGAPMQVK